MSHQKRKQIKIQIYGKNRVIRKIEVDEENQLEGYYKNCWFQIEIKNNEKSRFGAYEEHTTCYIYCSAPSGSVIYDGYGHHRKGLRYGEPFTVDEALEDVMKNILWEERPKDE